MEPIYIHNVCIFKDEQMKRTKTEAHITRNYIIDKAVELFLKRGFSATTLDEIAIRANVTRGAIYWHFKDKLDILNELIDVEHQKLTKLLDELFAEDIDPFAKMENIISRIVIHFFNNKSFQRFIELTWFKIEYTKVAKLQRTKSEISKYFIKNYKLIVEEAQKSGQICSVVKPHDVAITVRYMIDGMYRSSYLFTNQINTKEQAISAFNSYLNLIKT